MLVSHRRHAPPLEGVKLELDRVIFQGWMLRRSWMEGVVQDERLTTRLGRGAPAGRARLVVALEGRTSVFHRAPTGRERCVAVEPGQFVVVRDLDETFTRAEPGASFEIDWAHDSALADGPVPELCAGTLGAVARARVEGLARALRDVSANGSSPLANTLEHALSALRAEGLPLAGAPSHTFVADPCQPLVDAFDAELGNLASVPALATIETSLGLSRRTVARKVREATTRFGISALAGLDWRGARDFYRLLLGSILASHPAASTAAVASMLGYSAPSALCHAFAHAGLASPLALGAQARVG